MRQGNGTELLGVNDPRATSIGLIHVAPDDDRKSVLAAIITQEKLGRKQVAVVLPEQNKAFQSALDFDDLKSYRRKLHTQIVFVAPGGSGPAEFARQRRFPVYSSLESYTRALLEDQGSADQDADKKVRLFGGTHRSAPSPSTPNGPEPVTPASEDETRRRSSVAPFIAGAAAGGAAGLAAGDIARAHAAPGPGASENTATPPQNANRTTPTSGPGSASSEDEEWEALPPPTPTPAGAGAAAGAAASQTGRAAAANGTPNAESAGGPGIIELPVQKRTTAQLNPGQQPANTTAPTRRRSAGKTAGAVAAGAAGAAAAGAAAGMAATSATPPTRTTGAGGGPPTRGASGGGGGGPRRSRRGWLLGAILVLIVILLVGVSIAANAQPRLLDPLRAVLPKVAPPATVTITPATTIVQNTYVVTGVTGTPNAAQHQVSARVLTGSAASQPITINATGHNQVPGAEATGTLTFFNGSGSSFTVGAGVAIPVNNGLSIITSSSITIPAGNPGISFGSASGPAHASAVGAAGNIAANTINELCCTANNFIRVENTRAFTGGQDPKNYNFVQRGDVNSAVSGVQNTLAQQASRSVTSQLHTGEQLAGSEQCTPKATPSGPVGDTGANVSSITLNVTVTCTGTAYNQQGVQSLVTGLLQAKARSDPADSGYAPVGSVVTQTSVQGVSDGTVSLLVNARWLWEFQITPALEQQWAKQIKGMSVSKATAFLQGQRGIHGVTIQASGGTLPTDPTQIGFTLQNVQGLQGSSTPPVGSPTVTAPQLASPQSPVPGNGDTGGATQS